jgi:hypothetical protein
MALAARFADVDVFVLTVADAPMVALHSTKHATSPEANGLA